VTTPSATALQPARAPRIAVLPVALVFIVAVTIGAIAAVAAINLSQTDGDADVPAAVTSNAELARLLGNMDAAAARGDVRLFLAFRQDLAELIGAVGVAEHYGAGYPLQGGLAGPSRVAITREAGSFAPGYPLHGGFAGASQVDAPTIRWADPTDHLKYRNEPPKFDWSDNSGGI
jgi:hypothetical protein